MAQRDGTLQRNFQGYSTAAGSSLYGFGVSSISSTADSYRQNFKDLANWRAALDAGRLPVERGLILSGGRPAAARPHHGADVRPPAGLCGARPRIRL